MNVSSENHCKKINCQVLNLLLMLLKKMHVILHIWYGYCTIWSIVWKLLEFPSMADNFCSYFLQCLQKDLINFLYQHAKVQWFFWKFGNFLYWYGNFCHFTAPFNDFPEYSVYSSRILWIIDVFEVCSGPAVSCKRNRSSLMNFPIIWGFLKRKC